MSISLIKRLIYFENIGVALRNGKNVSDFRFDQVYPAHVQECSNPHWTPVAVAKRAAEWLVADSGARILDVGSGAGKFCIVGALTTDGEFVGIEQRPYLVEAAQSAVKQWNVQRASFVAGNMAKIDWHQFTGFYLFNPFYEQINENRRIDKSISYSGLLFMRYLDIVKDNLRDALPGTRVVTYHGFGGDMPSCYECLISELHECGTLELWVKK